MARTKKQKNQSENMRVETMEEYLARGGKVTVCPAGMRSEDVVEKFNPKRRGRRKKTD